jgi:hypothetical protein
MARNTFSAAQNAPSDTKRRNESDAVVQKRFFFFRFFMVVPDLTIFISQLGRSIFGG